MPAPFIMDIVEGIELVRVPVEQIVVCQRHRSRTSRRVLTLSEQQFVNCVKIDSACYGGLMDKWFAFAVCTEDSYSNQGYPLGFDLLREAVELAQGN